MYKFKPGDKVICIRGHRDVFTEGRMYIIEESYTKDGSIYVNISGSLETKGWDENRFVLAYSLKDLIRDCGGVK